MLERDIQRRCLDWLHLKGIFAWRSNNIPVPLVGGGFRRFTGLRGVSDILGLFTQRVETNTPEGLQWTSFGILLAVEVKQPRKRPTTEQQTFLEEVNRCGGIGLCVHSLEELEKGLELYW